MPGMGPLLHRTSASRRGICSRRIAPRSTIDSVEVLVCRQVSSSLPLFLCSLVEVFRFITPSKFFGSASRRRKAERVLPSKRSGPVGPSCLCISEIRTTPRTSCTRRSRGPWVMNPFDSFRMPDSLIWRHSYQQCLWGSGWSPRAKAEGLCQGSEAPYAPRMCAISRRKTSPTGKSAPPISTASGRRL